MAGQDHYLGPHGSRERREAYDRLVAEWLAGGRASTASSPSDGRSSSDGISVVEVVAAFWRHAHVYYRRPDGTPTKEAKNFRHALRPLKRLYGDLPAALFGPVALRAVREEMVRRGWCRTHVNRQINRLRHVFKWAAGRELVSALVYYALQAVEGLKAGTSEARESAAVAPVDEAHALAAAELMSPPVKAMVELQLLTAMRPGEVIAMRACDIDTSGDDGTWTYTPATHKTAHHRHARQIILGPKRPFQTRSS